MGPQYTSQNTRPGLSYWCPRKGAYIWGRNIDPGELWEVRVAATVSDYEGNLASGVQELFSHQRQLTLPEAWKEPVTSSSRWL